LTLFESKPTTFHVIGVIVRLAAAETEFCGTIKDQIKTKITVQVKIK